MATSSPSQPLLTHGAPARPSPRRPRPRPRRPRLRRPRPRPFLLGPQPIPIPVPFSFFNDASPRWTPSAHSLTAGAQLRPPPTHPCPHPPPPQAPLAAPTSAPHNSHQTSFAHSFSSSSSSSPRSRLPSSIDDRGVQRAHACSGIRYGEQSLGLSRPRPFLKVSRRGVGKGRAGKRSEHARASMETASDEINSPRRIASH